MNSHAQLQDTLHNTLHDTPYKTLHDTPYKTLHDTNLDAIQEPVLEPVQGLNLYQSNNTPITPSCSGVMWLTGLSGAGKTTLAQNLKRMLSNTYGIQAFVLDGDDLRAGVCSDLGFTDADRQENVRRIAEIAKLLFESGIFTIVACISPSGPARAFARSLVSENKFIEVFVDTPFAECEKRDVKGLYKRARANKINNFTGIGSSYQRPETPEIHLLNGQQSIEESTNRLLRYLCEHHFIELPTCAPKA